MNVEVYSERLATLHEYYFPKKFKKSNKKDLKLLTNP